MTSLAPTMSTSTPSFNCSTLPNAASIHDEQHPIYFLHIPKTAGTTFTRFLEEHVERRNICPAHLWHQMVTLPAEEVASNRLIRGHFYSFLYKHVPDPLRYVIFLRDPIERALSHYGHVVKDTGHYFHRRAMELGTFNAYLLDPETAPTVSNFQLRSLALDLDPHAIARSLTTQDLSNLELERRLETAPFDRPLTHMLEIAKLRLLQMCFVGITERYEESIELFCRSFGSRRPDAAVAHNVNASRLQQWDINQTDLQLLRKLNHADYELYDFACGLFFNAQTKGR